MMPPVADSRAPGTPGKRTYVSETTTSKPWSLDAVSSKGRILLAEDESVMRNALERVLTTLGYSVTSAEDGYWAMRKLVEEGPFDVALLDIRMPAMDGMEVLERAVENYPLTSVVMMTGQATVETAVRSLKLGAFDYLSKPFSDIWEVCEVRVGRAVEYSRHLRSASFAAERVVSELESSEGEFEGMIGTSPEMIHVYEMISGVAATSASVLIQGETGSGKELVARAIHLRSRRSGKAFVPLNCAALPPELLESELFGHEKGAFTGAHASKRGLFDEADGGTLFLDEIGEMPLALQAKLLRVLQEGEFRPVGSSRIHKVDVRILTATHQNLRMATAEGSFREDLFYRIAVVTIDVPSLRNRRQDIPMLAHHFLEILSEAAPHRVEGFTREAMLSLVEFDWPGNVRELRNVIEGALIFTKSTHIELQDIPERAQRRPSKSPLPGLHPDLVGMVYVEAKQRAVHDFESFYVGALLERSMGNVSAAARAAGMDRSNFRRLLRRHNDLH
jgi:two-component system response regulator HydG